MEFLRGRRIARAQRLRLTDKQIADRVIAGGLIIGALLMALVVIGVAAVLQRAFPEPERQNYKPAPARQATASGLPV